MNPIRIAVLSASRIVPDFLQAAAACPEVEVTALCTRPQSAEKGAALCAQYGIPKQYTDEAACYADPEVDAVYVATANHLHEQAARRALEAGCHVLLEKPFTATAAEARALFALADAKGLVLMEAITTPYLPQYAFLQQHLADLGPVRGAMASFCARSARYDDYLNGIWNTTFDPACLGGALNDMNVYNLHLLCGLLGQPQSAEYRPSLGPNGVDTAGLALLQYPGFTAACLAAKDSAGVNGCTLQGPGGCLAVQGGTNALTQVWLQQGTARTDGPAETEHRMVYEIRAFAQMIAGQDPTLEPAARARTLAVMDLLDTLHG